MKKDAFSFWLFLIFTFLISTATNAQQQVSAGQIDILSGVTDFTVPDDICQCDTIELDYEIKSTANFPTTSSFEYQFVVVAPFGASSLLELTKLEKNNPSVPLSSPADTFSPGRKKAFLAIPCNATIGLNALRIVNRSANGTITPVSSYSDTVFFNVNRIPTIASIDSVAVLRNNILTTPSNNPYTPELDFGLCKNDELILRLTTNADIIQWYNSGNLIVGETSDSISIKSEGLYYAKVMNLNSCFIYSDTMMVSSIKTATEIIFDPNNPLNSNAFLIDFPPSNSSPRDSLELCANESAIIEGPQEPIGIGVSFTYQWLTDSLNPSTGLREWYPLASSSATTRTLIIDPNSSAPGWNSYRLLVDDGLCQDTTPELSKFRVYVDTMPTGIITVIPLQANAPPSISSAACTSDSVKLGLFNSTPPNPLWNYQWEWFDANAAAGTNPWKSVSGGSESLGTLSFDTMPTLTIDTTLNAPGQPYHLNPEAALRFFRVRVAKKTINYNIETCVYYSDSMPVLWKPAYDLTIDNQAGINIIGQDSINFCEIDSVLISAPATPTDLSNQGYSFTYQWLSDSINNITGNRIIYPLSGETNQKLEIKETGRYFVAIEDGFCSTDTSKIYSVFVNQIPSIAVIDSIAMLRNSSFVNAENNPYTPIADIGICRNDSIVLELSTNARSIQWYEGANAIGNDTLSKLKIGAPGIYHAMVSNGGLCTAFSDTIIVSSITIPTEISFNINDPLNANAYLIDFPPANSSPNDSIELCASASAVIDGPQAPTALGLSFSYQWLKDSLNTSTNKIVWYPLLSNSATTRSLVIDQNSSEPGWNYYRLVVDDGFCQDTTTESAKFNVWVDTAASGSLVSLPFNGSLTPISFGNVCMSDSIKLGLFTNGVRDSLWNYQWQWYDPNSPAGTDFWKSVSGGSSSAGTLSFDTLSTIKIDTSLSALGQPYSQNPKASLRFFRLRIAKKTINYNIETCVFFTDSIAIRWQPFFNEINLVPSSSIISIGKDSINFCESDSAQIFAPNTPTELLNAGYAYTYQWLSDSIIKGSNTQIIYPLIGETNQFLTVKETGRYFVAINDGFCLADTTEIYTVIVDSFPITSIKEVTFPGSANGLTNLKLCLNDSALITATDTVRGSTPWQYQWQQLNLNSGVWTNILNDTAVSLVINSNYQRNQEDTAYFRLQTRYINTFGVESCSSLTDSLAIIFYQSPDLSIIPSDSINLCDGDSLFIIAAGNFTDINWDNGTVLSANRYVKEAGFYTVEATGINGCTARDTVRVYSATAAAVSAGSDRIVESGDVVTLTASGGTTYRWSANKPVQFSDTLSSSIQVFKILENGVLADTIVIYVEATDQNSCIGVDSLIFIVVSKTVSTPPNTTYNFFTPNGDGLNDTWDITELLNGDNCGIQIMNRWGSIVFDDANFSGIWTGASNSGKQLSDGTYYYILDCYNGDIRMANAVTLIRNQQ